METLPEPSGGPSCSLSDDSGGAGLGTGWAPECGWRVGGGRDGPERLTFPFTFPSCCQLPGSHVSSRGLSLCSEPS